MKSLGIRLPENNPPAANYQPFIKTGNLVFISGQTCKWNGILQYKGKVGKDYNLEEGKQAAHLCALNLLLQIKNACDGCLDKIKQCIRLNVYINTTDDFEDHAKIADGASDLIVHLFGERGKHVRTSLGSNSLPSQSTVEIDGIFEIENDL
ncbi:RidA family protein [Legionella sp.]|uniref:RidA family protein n=1 Tax=Legionella sp. TaxID=459 RepID=UPI003C8EC71A